MITYTAEHVPADRLAAVLAVAAAEEPQSIDVRAHKVSLANGAENVHGYRVEVEGISVQGLLKLDRANDPRLARPDLLYPDEIGQQA